MGLSSAGAQEDAEAQADQAVVTKEEEADEAAAEQAEEERCGVPDGFLSFCGVGHAAGGGLVASRITTLTLRECALTPKAVAMIAEAITRQVRVLSFTGRFAMPWHISHTAQLFFPQFHVRARCFALRVPFCSTLFHTVCVS